jgi:site-specific recombinase XerD
MSISGAEIAGTEPVQTTELDTDANSHDVEARRQWLTEAEVEAIIRHASGPRDKLMILRKLRRQKPVARYIFLTDRGAPMTRNGFFKLRQKAAAKADISDVHLHLLRHATGFKLVNQGFDTLSLVAYLGHRQVANTKRYCRMDSRRFEGLWRD